MRVLFASSSGVGHVQPMLPLALAVEARGHEVVWATAEDGCAWVRAAGIAAAEVGLSARERMAEYHRRWPEATELLGEERAAHTFPRLFGAVTAEAAFPALLDLAAAWQPEVVVSEAADFAAPVVAAAVGAPQATHGFGLVVPDERVAAAGAWAAPLWERVGLEPRPFGGCYDHLYIDVYPPSMQPGDLSHLGAIQRRRPESLTAPAGMEPSPEIVRLLDDPRPFVYLTFGTVFNVNDTFASAVDALAAMPEVVALVTVGPDGDPNGFGPLPQHVHVARYVPQAHLLEHADAVVSHAGSGTLLGALSHGIPQVCLPQAADQFRNARACAEAGAGVSLLGAAATREAIEDALRSVLHDEQYRADATRLADEIAAMPPVEEVAAAIERLGTASGESPARTRLVPRIPGSASRR